jgi:hypothetical protein
MLSEKPEEKYHIYERARNGARETCRHRERETKGMQKGYMIPISLSQNVFYLFMVYLTTLSKAQTIFYFLYYSYWG